MHLSKELRTELKHRAVGVKKGDTVKVMRGKLRGKSGVVTGVFYADQMVTIEKLMRKKSDGREVPVKVRTSNLVLTALDTKDSRRLQGESRKGTDTPSKKRTHSVAKKEKSGADRL